MDEESGQKREESETASFAQADGLRLTGVQCGGCNQPFKVLRVAREMYCCQACQIFSLIRTQVKRSVKRSNNFLPLSQRLGIS